MDILIKSFLNTDTSTQYIIILFFILIIIKPVYIIVKNSKIRGNITKGKFIYYKDFEADWISAKSGRKGVAGYKYNDGPGCYVIVIHNEKVKDDNFMQYENIYIGQSVHVCQRVHNHFTGKGKGDIYADVKYGKHAYVRIVPCKKEELNRLEKDLIAAFNATKSYNKTKGGAKTQ